ncbi:hypothetical protein L1887_32197 [Cichorium endivia]|nr:hypothetical protein L1887_32197 [Cichorium endivia]
MEGVFPSFPEIRTRCGRVVHQSVGCSDWFGICICIKDHGAVSHAFCCKFCSINSKTEANAAKKIVKLVMLRFQKNIIWYCRNDEESVYFYNMRMWLPLLVALGH